MSVKSSVGVVTDGLVFYVDAGNSNSYPGSGTTWSDLVGSNNGTLTNGPTFDSANGGSIVFDGANDRCTVDGVSTLNNATFFTFINPKANPGGYEGFAGGGTSDYSNGFVMDMGSSSTSTFSKCHFEGGVLRVNGGWNGMSSDNAFNNWYCICFTVSPTYVQFYLNGVAENGTARLNNSSSTINMTNFRLGARVYGNKGAQSDMALFALYDRSLSASEVLQNYNALKNRFI